MANQTEKQFLIGLALRRFNEQYNKNFRIDECDITSIPVRYGFQRSYEIMTRRLDDYLILHMHIRFEGTDALSLYRIEVDSARSQEAGSAGTLNDEVFVTTGTIDPYYIDSGIYKFRETEIDVSLLPYLLLEDGTPLLMEDGVPFMLEEFTA